MVRKMTRAGMKEAWAHCKAEVKKGKIPQKDVKKCVFKSFKKK